MSTDDDPETNSQKSTGIKDKKIVVTDAQLREEIEAELAKLRSKQRELEEMLELLDAPTEMAEETVGSKAELTASSEAAHEIAAKSKITSAAPIMPKPEIASKPATEVEPELHGEPETLDLASSSDTLLKKLISSDEHGRKEVFAEIVRSEDRNLIKSAIPVCLKGDSSSLVMDSIELIAKLKLEDLYSEFRAAAVHPDNKVRSFTLNAAQDVDQQFALQIAEILLKDEYLEIRERAAEHLHAQNRLLRHLIVMVEDATISKEMARWAEKKMIDPSSGKQPTSPAAGAQEKSQPIPTATQSATSSRGRSKLPSIPAQLSKFDRSLTFDTYVMGTSNMMCAHAAKAIVANPGPGIQPTFHLRYRGLR